MTFTAFHGTSVDFDAFDASSRGSLTNYPGSKLATFFAQSRSNAEHYADLSARTVGGTARVIEVTIALSRPLVLGFDLDAELEAIVDDDVAALTYAARHGYDGVIWPYGNANNAEWTAAVLDLATITIA